MVFEVIDEEKIIFINLIIFLDIIYLEIRINPNCQFYHLMKKECLLNFIT
jgi:hypothetical protein